jgi:hypothetical protein
VKPVAAKLAVCHGFEPQIFLQRHRILDGRVLDSTQLCRRHFAPFPGFARGPESRRPQEAADMVCPEGRGGAEGQPPVDAVMELLGDPFPFF